ncbi:MAG: hydrogenase [Candidatus Verstraetearchaeota archaeon]|nr:hydrogenase [Candidatus Verstraetearchaeota archaeon]
MRLNVGKVPNEILRDIVFPRLGTADSSVLLGPNIGEDAAIIRVGGKLVAFKSDPITGSVDEVGYLAIHVNANDIATRGAEPKWFLQCILLPEGSTLESLDKIARQMDSAAKEIGVSIVGGHTEVTPGIERPIVVGSMIGIIRNSRFFTSGGARPGDLLYMTKYAGLEGTAILSSDKRILSSQGESFVSRCKSLLALISVVKECRILREIEGVTSMHDLTEGGVLGGVWELAEAASIGVSLDLRCVPVLPETQIICEELGLDPYRLISSGSLLFTVTRGSEREVELSLKSSGIPFAKVGELLPPSEGRRYVDAQGKENTLEPPSTDELWRGVM